MSQFMTTTLQSPRSTLGWGKAMDHTKEKRRGGGRGVFQSSTGVIFVNIAKTQLFLYYLLLLSSSRAAVAFLLTFFGCQLSFSPQMRIAVP